MNRTALAIFAAGLVVGAIAVNTIEIGDTLAAPFNATTEKRADAGVVTSFCIFRTETGASFYAMMDVPEVRNLPDGGTRTAVLKLQSDHCVLTGANLTAAANFASGPAAACVRATHDLEQ